jgi:MFS family permease
MFGQKLLFNIGMCLFPIFTALTAVVRVSMRPSNTRRDANDAQSLVPLFLCRGLSGLAMAICIPAAVGITASTFRTEPARAHRPSEREDRERSPAGFGMLLGGFLASTGRWVQRKWVTLELTTRNGWIYLYVMLAVSSVVPIAIGFLVVPADKHHVNWAEARHALVHEVDWLGAVLATIGICLFTFCFIQSGLVPSGWSTPCELLVPPTHES